jgi:hypothetical protein
MKHCNEASFGKHTDAWKLYITPQENAISIGPHRHINHCITKSYASHHEAAAATNFSET